MWPFWAPSRAALVDRALDLAALRPGERFLDLGCGDGRTLERAARRGASVAGIEADPALAERARRRLDRAAIEGEVVAGDIFESTLDADVLFTYLAPATLQQLTPRFVSAQAGRLVTVDFPVPELETDDEDDGVYLYRLPATPAWRDGRVGWPSDGALVSVPPDRQSLTVLELHHPGGPVSVEVTPPLSGVVTIEVGVAVAEPHQAVAIDLRWEETQPQTFVHGRLCSPGVPPLPLFVIFGAGDDGLWELNDPACRALLQRARSAPVTSLDDLLAALE